MLYLIGGILVLIMFVMRIALGAALSFEITNPKVKGLIGFESWVADKDNEYNTLKLHFVWLALRWDWE